MGDEAEQFFIRIYTDEHITALLAPALRRRGYAAQSCVEANTLGWEDEEHLGRAGSREMDKSDEGEQLALIVHQIKSSPHKVRQSEEVIAHEATT